LKGFLNNETPNKKETNFSKKNRKSILSISDFTKEDIEEILSKAKKLEGMKREDKLKILHGKIVASLFFEPSTRTRLSFETAAQNLGARVVGFSDPSATSTSKGEILSDTIRIVEKYADYIVMRHYIEGAARRADELTTKPVINAGDGANQHPTQTLLDLYTIQKEYGKIDGTKIMMAGDLRHGRTVHSLLQALALFDDTEVLLAAPKGLEMPQSVIDDTNGRVKISTCETIEEGARKVDVLYATRIQKERFSDEKDYLKIKDAYTITQELVDNTNPELRIMHPLPRVNEIEHELDKTKNAIYFKQAANGIPVREAILSMLEARE
jgi:aspartate carbamoyltransferase catalytic subunit